MELVPVISIDTHTKDKRSHYFRYFGKNCFGLAIYLKPVKETESKPVSEEIRKILTNYLDGLKEEKNRKNPVRGIIGVLNKLNRAIVNSGEDVAYDFVIVLCYKGYIFIFGSGALPVVVLNRHGITESIMLDGFKVSEKDYPLYRLGTLSEVNSDKLLFDVRPCLPPFKVVISDRDVSHIMRIIDLPVLFGLAIENFNKRLVAETLSKDKEDIDLISLCA